jgi:putative DNA primase/helicase
LLASGISTAGVFRTVEKAHPTLLIDEIDRFLKNSEETIGVLNAGHRRGGQVVRVVETRDGYEPRAFDCFSPAALTGIGKLPDTLDDRSVKVKLRRKRRDEKVASLRLDRMEAFEILSRKAARWADDTRARLAEADPDMPPVLFNRVADNWRPLIAVADAAGGEWPERARRVAEAAAAQDPDESARTILLADLRDLFDREPSGVLFTKEDILPVLAGMDHRPWPEWRNDKPLSAKQLAGLLKPFRVSPGTVRRGDRTDKGYRRADLEDAFARYLDEASAFQSVTPSQVANSAGFGDFQSVTHSENVTDPMAKKSRTPAGCDGVTDQDPLASEEEATWTA